MVSTMASPVFADAANATRATRLPQNPIVTPASSEKLGDNINGPSLIKVPSWVKHPLGKYYLYFAHHGGKSIRLAFASELKGPWHIYEPGTLRLEQAHAVTITLLRPTCTSIPVVANCECTSIVLPALQEM
jgi:hypothetical protein